MQAIDDDRARPRSIRAGYLRGVGRYALALSEWVEAWEALDAVGDDPPAELLHRERRTWSRCRGLRRELALDEAFRIGLMAAEAAHRRLADQAGRGVAVAEAIARSGDGSSYGR